MSRFVSISLATIGVLALSGIAVAAEPTQSDFDACNRAAQAAISSPSASPQTAGRTGPEVTTPAGTPDTTAGVQPGGAGAKTGPMITGTGRTPGSAGGVSGGTGAVAKDGASGTAGGDMHARGMAQDAGKDPRYSAAYQDCMKQRGF